MQRFHLLYLSANPKLVIFFFLLYFLPVLDLELSPSGLANTDTFHFKMSKIPFLSLIIGVGKISVYRNCHCQGDEGEVSKILVLD